MENQKTEYKLVWKEDLLKNVSAFSNTDGDCIFIGIDDSGRVVGVENRISFVNEGKFPPEITSENLKKEHLSKPRNILLADIFYKCGFIESWGRGTLKIIRECKRVNFPEPEFIEENGVINTIIYNNAGDNAGDNLNTTMRLIVSLIKENPQITIPDLSKKININPRNVEKNIARLKKLSIIERIGSAKSGYWKLK